ncbi:hypothetical protein INR79_09530 [Vibrio sp. SCSIO 43132]|uniref:hypothetical protein n=1 Tax=Vibrio sp. SCSIO 43132 TaxID=2779363 RepID=UPI001CA8D65B|nr:hypothetical protein [Vibrio sp. SCSIO 43132]UAB68789.1 hypothetical protein INR79_09530 [Vibrio sp. SCSIO 43132]
MNNEIVKDFNLGGSIEQALSGNYELKPSDVIQEAWKYTVKNFFSFSPAIMALIVIQALIFFIALKMQLGDPSVLLSLLQTPEKMDPQIVSSLLFANFSYELISAPLSAGISLMAMSHAAGLRTKSRHMAKGLQYTIPIILATMFNLLLQGVAGQLLPFLSIYLTIAFSHSILLICEKRIPPMQSLLLSLRAVNKKLLPIAGIYLVVAFMFFMATIFYGIGLIFVVPFFFHVKGILYRNMFGIQLKIVASDIPAKPQQGPDNSGTFDA